MIRQSFYAVIGLLLVVCSAVAMGADLHRVVVLDAGTTRGVENHRLLLLEIESEKVLASAELGHPTNLAVSPDGRTVAALTTVGAGAGRETRLNFYRAADLSLEQSGKFPKGISPLNRQSGVAASIHFSPDGNEIVFCGLATHGNVDAATTAIMRMKRELDADGYYRSVTAATIEPCRAVDFVSFAKWPKAIVLNQTTTELLTVDLEGGEILSTLKVAEPGPDHFAPMRLRGVAISGGSQYAYFLPRKTGHVKKIDLLAEPPVVIATGSKDPDLRPLIAAVSEKEDSVFALEERPVLEERRALPAWAYAPSRWVGVFRASDVRFQRQIALPLADCHWLTASRDGKFLYAIGPVTGPPFDDLSVKESRLAVIDASSGREVRILQAGQRPAALFPVAEQ
jgi:hypothetical protein